MENWRERVSLRPIIFEDIDLLLSPAFLTGDVILMAVEAENQSIELTDSLSSLPPVCRENSEICQIYLKSSVLVC